MWALVIARVDPLLPGNVVLPGHGGAAPVSNQPTPKCQPVAEISRDAGHDKARRRTSAKRQTQVVDDAIFGARPSRRVVRQPAHTLGFKRVVARERAALFTDLP